MTRFLLIRHAENDTIGLSLAGRAAGVHLNARGNEQASSLATTLQELPVIIIFCSPMERCLETAQPLANALSLKLEIAATIQEIDFGDWTGARLAELDGDPVWNKWNISRSTARPPHGESMLEVQDRFLLQLDQWAARHPDGLIAVFSHGDPIKAIALHCCDVSLDAILDFEIEPASVTVVDWSQHHDLRLLGAKASEVVRELRLADAAFPIRA